MPSASATCAAVTWLTPHVPDEPLLLQLDQGLEGLGEGALHRDVAHPRHPQDNDVQHVQPELVQVVVHRPAQFRRGQCLGPPAVRRPARPHLGDDDQLVGVGVQR
jgi:hypothetical protein